MKYKIIRMYRKENHKDNGMVIKRGLTLKQAQEHCQREDTHKPGVWFDGYTEDKA